MEVKAPIPPPVLNPDIPASTYEGIILIASSKIDFARTLSKRTGSATETGSELDVKTVDKLIAGVPSKWYIYLISAHGTENGRPSKRSKVAS